MHCDIDDISHDGVLTEARDGGMPQRVAGKRSRKWTRNDADPSARQPPRLRPVWPHFSREFELGARAGCRLRVLVARNRWCLSGRSVIPGVMFLVRFPPRLRLLVRACAYVFTLVLLFLLHFLVMRDVSCVRHGDSIKPLKLRLLAQGSRRTNGRPPCDTRSFSSDVQSSG